MKLEAVLLTQHVTFGRNTKNFFAANDVNIPGISLTRMKDGSVLLSAEPTFSKEDLILGSSIIASMKVKKGSTTATTQEAEIEHTDLAMEEHEAPKKRGRPSKQSVNE